MSFKMVQNYSLSQSNNYVQDGIDTYIAHHVISKLPYLLKKIVNTKDSSDRSKYQSLLNQISILKILSSPSIVQCHKMLKTSNNIYLVYDYCDGSPLLQVIPSQSKQQKISIILQLIDALKVMGKSSVVHTNLKPSSIIVSNDNKIKIMNFTYGHNRENKKSIPVEFKPPTSNYIAPQITRDGIIHEKSDFYSLGVIISQMNLIQNSMLAIEKHANGALADVVERLKSSDPNDRPQLKELEVALRGIRENNSPKKSRDSDRKSQEIQSGSGSSLKKTNSINSNNSDRSEKKIMIPIPTQPTKESIQKQKKFVLQILKRRNFAIFLLQMSEACLRIEDEDRKLGIFLSYLLMKKSSLIICGLLGYLKGEKQYEKQIDKAILDKAERTCFEKKPDFFKLVSTIHKQSANQKRWLQDIYRNISPELPQKWKQIASEDNVNDKALLTFIVDFLHEIIEGNEDAVSDKLVESLYLMSEIIPHRSYERMFQEMISQEKTSLDQQHLYIHVKKIKRKQLLSQIAARIKSQL